MNKLKIISIRSLFVGVFLVAIEVLVSAGTISPLIVSRPTAMGLALWQDIASGEIPKLFLTTMVEVAIAFGLSAILGFCAGYLLWRYEQWGVAYETLLA